MKQRIFTERIKVPANRELNMPAIEKDVVFFNGYCGSPNPHDCIILYGGECPYEQEMEGN